MEVLLEHLIHKLLQHRRCIDQAFLHHPVFTVVCGGHKMVVHSSPFQIQLRLYALQRSNLGGYSQKFQGCWDEVRQIAELVSNLVEEVVIYAGLQASIFAKKKKKSWSSRGFRWMNTALVEGLLNILLHGLLLGDGKWVNLSIGCWLTGYQSPDVWRGSW